MGPGRGYEQGEGVGDKGILLSQELNLPAFSLVQRWGSGELRDRLQPYLFQDYARRWNVDKLSGERPFDLLSVGVGARYNLGSYFSL